MAGTLFDAYRTDAPAARSFFSGHYGDPGARRRAVENALERPLASDVARGLSEQNQRLPPSRARDANLAALEHGAAAVVTGQQVGLFLGPLYTAYKAASAIAIARALARETGRPVVPVFWLQTEDHDLVEIAACNLPCAGGSRTLSVPASLEERTSIAHRTLPDSIEACVRELHAELSNLPHAEAELARIERHYRSGATFGAAFAGLLAELFDELVFVDPRDRAFARVQREVHRTALTRHQELAEALTARGRDIEAAGFEVQVRLRSDAALSFFHPDGAEGARFRVDPSQVEEAIGWLDRDPLRFSTSALLRPLLQDSLLPTAAYVGGPGEIAYTAQLGPLYAAFSRPAPLVVPRARLRIIEDKTRRVLARLSLSPDDLSAPLPEILARVSRNAGEGLAPDELQASLSAAFSRVMEEAMAKLEPLDPVLAKERRKTEAGVAHSIQKLAAKYQHVLAHRDRTRVEQVERLKSALYPEGAPQERHFSLPYFMARYGTPFLDQVRAAIDPFDATPKDLHP